MKTIFSLTLILFLIFSFSLESQVVVANNSTNFPKFDNKKKKRPIQTKMKKGETKEFLLYVFKDNVYTIDFDVPKKFKRLNFRIENENGDIIFDNAISSYCTSAIVYAKNTQQLKLIITTQPPNFFQSNKKQYKINIKITYERNKSS